MDRENYTFYLVSVQFMMTQFTSQLMLNLHDLCDYIDDNRPTSVAGRDKKQTYYQRLSFIASGSSLNCVSHRSIN
jgi:hypothetical protein